MKERGLGRPPGTAGGGEGRGPGRGGGGVGTLGAGAWGKGDPRPGLRLTGVSKWRLLTTHCVSGPSFSSVMATACGELLSRPRSTEEETGSEVGHLPSALSPGPNRRAPFPSGCLPPGARGRLRRCGLPACPPRARGRNGQGSIGSALLSDLRSLDRISFRGPVPSDRRALFRAGPGFRSWSKKKGVPPPPRCPTSQLPTCWARRVRGQTRTEHPGSSGRLTSGCGVTTPAARRRRRRGATAAGTGVSGGMRWKRLVKQKEVGVGGEREQDCQRIL